MAHEEIEKLRLRVEKDPGSRLFLPLAEEYRKAGMVDEAISVLLIGLERQPGYTSARVAIGRIYFEKNMLPEAQVEFEKVVSVVPDNLFAHKKLAEIYMDLGENEKAVSEFKAILALNPFDEEAKAYLETVEMPSAGKPAAFPVEQEGERALSFEEEVQVEVAEESFHEGTGDEALDIGQTVFAEPELFEDEFEEFSKTFSEDLEAETHAEEAQKDAGTAFGQSAEPEGMPVVEEAFESGSDLEGNHKETSDVDVSRADSFVAGGEYAQAFEMYRRILSDFPGNTHVLQRMSELKAFLKMIGKGDEITVSRLGAFLGGIKRRFGSGE